MVTENLKARLARSRRGFTLIEIMIVVLIIGILLAIAVPNFVRAREQSRSKSCQANLKQIDSAKEQWAMDNKKNTGDSVAMTDIAGATLYIKSEPVCPSNGTYTPAAIGTAPTCSVGNTNTLYPHVLP